MKIVTNTYHRAVVLAVFVAFTAASSTLPFPNPVGPTGDNPWTLLHKKDGIVVFYDIQDCLRDNLLLCFKLVNDTGQLRKIRFRAEVLHPDDTKETFNFIKSVAPYTTEKSDCSEETRLSGLVRPLKNGSEKSIVTLYFQDSPLISNRD